MVGAQFRRGFAAGLGGPTQEAQYLGEILLVVLGADLIDRRGHPRVQAGHV
jgi:hypothetical protein